MGYDDDDFMSSGSRTVPFEVPGDSVSGFVISPPEKRIQTEEDGSPKTFKDGTPREMYLVRIMTELRDPEDPSDDGERTLYLKWKSHKAVVAAVRASGAKGLQRGGYLTLTMTGFGPKSNPKFNPPKFWAAEYIPPDGNVDFMGPEEPAPAPKSQPQPQVQTSAPVATADSRAAAMERLRQQQANALAARSSHHAGGEPPF